MEEAEVARSAARDAISEVSPSPLRAALEDAISDASMVPGALTLLSASAVGGPADDDAVAERAAGVQLVYEGLRITRGLVDDEPWTGDPDLDADLDVIGADILVARGFRLLAHTDAADDAVTTVRTFGRRQTDVHAGRHSDTPTLEASVFELAAVAGATATGTDTSLPLRQYAASLAHAQDTTPLPPAADVLPDAIDDTLQRIAKPTPEDTPKPHSATDP